ncbi:hypothetical protein CK203_020622 [Vitis vinifera]|uniref:Phytocyanin domain-containing protein n=1 Tax=Vitis vinifera TaxID=29760 RepID=A0A438FN06_VITVI|nr:hypothetical protein CK203_020622 [Vitis vinifera]
MGFTSGQGVVTLLVLTASLLAVGMANRPIAGKPANHWNSGFNHSSWGPRNNPFHPNNTRPPKKFIVGGSERWRYGFNYTDWALKNGPFYINDTLGEFMISKQHHISSQRILAAKLWELPDVRPEQSQASGYGAQGGRKGFGFVLKNLWPHYFACGEHNGLHCKEGMMKFSVMPLFRPCHG